MLVVSYQQLMAYLWGCRCCLNCRSSRFQLNFAPPDLDIPPLPARGL